VKRQVVDGGVNMLYNRLRKIIQFAF